MPVTALSTPSTPQSPRYAKARSRTPGNSANSGGTASPITSAFASAQRSATACENWRATHSAAAAVSPSGSGWAGPSSAQSTAAAPARRSASSNAGWSTHQPASFTARSLTRGGGWMPFLIGSKRTNRRNIHTWSRAGVPAPATRGTCLPLPVQRVSKLSRKRASGGSRAVTCRTTSSTSAAGTGMATVSATAGSRAAATNAATSSR